MRQRIVGLIQTYVLFLILFVLQKVFFLVYYHSFYEAASFTDYLKIIWNGFPLDFSIAGYLTILPGLLLLASVWTVSKWLFRIWRIYSVFIAILLSVIFIVDLGLYEHWGFRLDSIPLFYFFSSPKDAMASIGALQIVGGLTAFVLSTGALVWAFEWLVRRFRRNLRPVSHRIAASVVMFVLTGLLFIPIRGGFTVSTMNTGKVYFSNNLRYNHAATNPAFSLMESLLKQKDFASQYRFMEAAQADALLQKMLDPQVLDSCSVVPDSLRTRLFKTERPNVVFVILESFSSKLMTELGGEPDIAVNMDSLSHEGILFTNFYANSFRTDRGLVSILSGYPAQPTTSLMKYPRKTQNLPAISRSLRNAGYHTRYYYGGDADFTNMRSYLVSSGFEKIISDRDFKLSERLSKWGVHDHLVFRRFIDDLKSEADGKAAEKEQTPFFRVLQTSSSHEPFEVPYRRLENDRLNAFAYTDSCVGDFVKHFRELPQWDNTVIVLVPDHLGCYPQYPDNLALYRYQIPLLMVGGAVCEPKRIDVYGSQHDLAATLLAQLSLSHHDFRFSKDMLNPLAPHFAFFTVPDAFGVATPQNQIIYNCEASAVAVDEGTEKGANLLSGQAYLQKIYDDIAKR